MKKKHVIPLFFVLIIILAAVLAAVITSIKPEIGECKSFFCDVKVLSLKTNIRVSNETENIGNIRGKVIRFLTDPLTMYNNEGTKIAYGSDEYHLIAQDSHMIFVNDRPSVEMVGKINLLSDSYDIYDTHGQKIATAKFNMFNTYGSIVSTDGKLWADYHSNLLRFDYDVRITYDCKLDNVTVLMMMASFYSDRTADLSSSSSSNSNSNSNSN